MNAHSNPPPWPECEVAVLGGGPAGAAAALTLARAGRVVVVLEKSSYDQPRIGETLPPRARSPLVELGVWEPFIAAGHLPSPGVLAAWGAAELYQNHFIRNPYGHGWHLDRQRFDAMLAQAAQQAGAQLHLGAQVTSCLRADDGRWQVMFTSGGQPHQLRAQVLLDATGRAAQVARQQGAQRINTDRLIGLGGLLTVRSLGCDPCTLVEATADGWWYSACLPESRLMAVFMTDADLLPRARSAWPAFWHARWQQTVHTQERLRDCAPPATLRVAAANSSRLDRVCGSGWLAVGDAALSFDPLSSQGLLHALASGLCAGTTSHRYLAGEAAALGEYASQMDDVARAYARLHAAYYEREQRWPQSAFWHRRFTKPSQARG